MKKIEEILENYKEYETALDDRFGVRLCEFLTEEQAKQIGYGAAEGYEWKVEKEWTKENIIKQLKEDIKFGLEKAQNGRGISASLMFDVVKSWLKVLEDEDTLIHFNYYYNYGIDAFKNAKKIYCKKGN